MDRKRHPQFSSEAGHPSKRMKTSACDPNSPYEDPNGLSLSDSGVSTPCLRADHVSSPSLYPTPAISDGLVNEYDQYETQCSINEDNREGFMECDVDATDLGNEIICYGMLFEVKAQFLNFKTPLEDIAIQESNGTVSLKLAQKRHTLIVDDNDVELAILNINVTEAMKSLNQLAMMDFEIYTSHEKWREGLQKNKSSARGTTLDIEINIYGPSSKSPDVGRILSKANLCLQHPRLPREGVRYNNPHYITFEELEMEQLQLSDCPMPVSMSVPATKFDEISGVLNELAHENQLDAVQADTARIKTCLKSYQQEAVDFIRRREEEITASTFSLWDWNEGNELNYQSPHFHHAILGIKRSTRPNENFGGILADEMGLGKTLSMLSSISMSLPLARLFEASYASGSLVEPIKLATHATLVVVPSELILGEWIVQVTQHFTADAFKYLIFHGASRSNDFAVIADNDLILTTYDTLAVELLKRDGVLHQLLWYRVVLDEAHLICNRQTDRFRTVDRLQAKYRWCVTGTPIQNHVNDLAALLQFLKVPYLNSTSTFRGHVSRPLEKREPQSITILKRVLQSMCLRRTSEVLHLPKINEETYEINLSSEEWQGYKQIGQASCKAMDDAICGARSPKARNTLFQTIMKLRLFCNHGFAYPTAGIPNAEEELSCLQLSGSAVCSGCSETVESINDSDDISAGVLGVCGHLICHDCASKCNDPSTDTGDSSLKSRVCPTCATREEAPTKTARKRKRSVKEQQFSPRASTKLQYLIDDLRRHQQTDKSIVFSSWTRTVDLVSALLGKAGMKHAVVNGSLPVPHRREQLKLFESNPNISVLLMTLRTGSAGLNLTSASRVHIVEPEWNPSTEKQAIGRAVRLGQTKQVTVIRYIARETIEQYIRDTQHRKTRLAKVAWDESSPEDFAEKTQALMDLKFAIKTG